VDKARYLVEAHVLEGRAVSELAAAHGVHRSWIYKLLSLEELQGQLDAFRHYYNHIRPHRALGGRTPLQAYSGRVKARPAGTTASTYFRVRKDRVDDTGKVSLRYDSKLYKIGLGRAHKGRTVRLLVADRNVRVIDANGELIRELTLDPSRDYQPHTRA
jgi:Integrase core domain